MGKNSLGALSFKQVLVWLKKLLLMDRDRYPRRCFETLCNLSNKGKSAAKYNWVSQVKSIFFEPIGELGVWENISNITHAVFTDRLWEKYIEYMRIQDLESCRRSTSLIIYNNLDFIKVQKDYLKLNLKIEEKRFVAQLRLLNKNCSRLIFNNKIFSIKNEITCDYCNINEVNLFHFVFDCECFNKDRTIIKASCEIKKMSNENALLNIFNSYNVVFTKNLIKFIERILIWNIEQGKDCIKIIEI